MRRASLGAATRATSPASTAAATVRAGFAARVFDGGAYRPGAQAYLRRFGAGMVGTLAAIVGSMVLMRFGI